MEAWAIALITVFLGAVMALIGVMIKVIFSLAGQVGKFGGFVSDLTTKLTALENTVSKIKPCPYGECPLLEQDRATRAQPRQPD